VYILSGLIGGSFGFGMSIIIRLELALPGFLICSSLQYNSCCGIEIVYGSLIVSKLHFGSFYQCKEDLLVITYNKLVMNLSQLSKHCLSIVCLNVVDLKQGMLSVDPIS
jgi:hypothetical protein